MWLTRRGYGAVGIVVLAELMALGFGARALNAIAAPALIALAASVVQLRMAEPPTATRRPIPPGFPDETRELRADIGGGGVASVSQPIPDGLAADSRSARLSLPGEFVVGLTYRRRGTYSLPPLDVTVTDLLGLVGKRYSIGGEATVTVYPPVYRLSGGERLFRSAVDDHAIERGAFDSLREYVPGDPLRDVHWKSSAKGGETLYVREFVDRRVSEDVVIVATGEPGRDDAMATAAASVAAMALDAGLGVALHTPDDSVPMGRGETHRTAVFEALARASADTFPADRRPEADVRVHATADGVELSIGERTSSLDELTVSRDNPLVGGTSA